MKVTMGNSEAKDFLKKNLKAFPGYLIDSVRYTSYGELEIELKTIEEVVFRPPTEQPL